ncbi:MAG TPA: peptidylprolyl isomerase [Candidatus Eisenbacteria bacterium]|jgi:peptidyl-prolyl cis-trans isomerase A (cyclophilin A)|nr:peptidylprolyl isomerase [Candidatus Eisenbacteria bacterium]
MQNNRRSLVTRVALAAILFIAGCKSNNQTAQTPPPAEQPQAEVPAQSAAPAEPTSSNAQVPATEPLHSAGKLESKPADSKALLSPKKLTEKAPDAYKVKFDTTRGSFTVSVTRAWAPMGADRFYNLVKHHFYDNAAFFRVVPNFVVQFGISPNPAVSAAWKHTEIKDDPVAQTNQRGSLTFATAGPNTRTTQIFINLKDNARLDGMGFSPFAMVDGNGMNVVEMMYEGYGDSAGPDQDQLEKQGDPYLKKGWPKLDYIKSATLVP